jgi:fructose-1,6-bisphosphatase/inositol monophosphatase family enzyme
MWWDAHRRAFPRCGPRGGVTASNGTKSFVRGAPPWGTLVAVEEAGRIIADVAFFPAVDQLLARADGCGCWWTAATATLPPQSATSVALDAIVRKTLCA